MKKSKLKILFSQYWGVISVRLYDENLKKTVGKIELFDLVAFLDKKIKKGEFKMGKKFKGNALPIITLK